MVLAAPPTLYYCGEKKINRALLDIKHNLGAEFPNLKATHPAMMHTINFERFTTTT
jgi:hypothetical protein